VIGWVPRLGHKPPLGGKVLVVTPSTGPSDAAVRVATLLTRPDGGHGHVLITRSETEPPPDRAVMQRISRHGFDGHIRTEVSELPDAVTKAVLTMEPSLVIVDDPAFDATPGRVPLLIVRGAALDAVSVIADGEDSDGVRMRSRAAWRPSPRAYEGGGGGGSGGRSSSGSASVSVSDIQSSDWR
jgi:hypothetical protein